MQGNFLQLTPHYNTNTNILKETSYFMNTLMEVGLLASKLTWNCIPDETGLSCETVTGALPENRQLSHTSLTQQYRSS